MNRRLNIQKIVQHVVLDDIPNPSQLLNDEMATTVNEFLAKYQSINFFEYFLIHYRGDIKSIERLINDYLSHFADAGDWAKSRQAMQRLIFLLPNAQLDSNLRDSIFSAILQQTRSSDERIIQKLFLYDARATIRHLGFMGEQGNYQVIANLCSWALNEQASKYTKNSTTCGSR